MTDPTTAPAPSVTEPTVRAMVSAWLDQNQHRRVLALRAKPDWPEGRTVEVAGTTVPVVACVSALAVRAALAEHGDEERLVILTDRDERDLGTGILAHLTKHRLVGVDLWDAVRAQFRTPLIDPQLPRQGEWAARALLEFAPPEGWPPPPGGVITREVAMRALAGQLLHTSDDALDAAGVLQWTTRATEVVQFTTLDSETREGISAWLADTAGPVARWALAAVNTDYGTDAIPLGLVAGLLWADDTPSSTVTAAQVRIEHYLGGNQPSGDEAKKWSEAAHAWVERLVRTDRPTVDRVVARAEELLDTVQAGQLLPRSTVLPGALHRQLWDFAAGIRNALPTPSSDQLAAVEQTLGRVHDHTLAAGDPRVAVATMALRLLRWLALPEPDVPVTLADAVDQHVREGGWVDRARLDVWTGDSDPAVADAYRSLLTAVDGRRARQDERFAELLATATAAAERPGSMLLVEDVLGRVVRPLVDSGERVLLIVADGMGMAVGSEVLDDIARSGWIELSPEGGSRTGALAALPTVTETCRTSLLSGELCSGTQAQERDGLAALFGPSTRLFHKEDLMAGAGAMLPNKVTEALHDQEIPVVAAVVNTIDDALERSDAAGSDWNLGTIRQLRALLHSTHDRVVVLTSDHGHVVDRGPDAEPRSHSDATAARWRPPTTPAGDGEILARGRRVALGGGQVVLPWKETVRYTSRKAGYHGGASPAEAVIPLAVLTTGSATAMSGWAPAPPQAPRWWLGPVAMPQTFPEPKPVELPPTAKATLFDTIDGLDAPVAEPAAEPAETLVDAVLTSDVYAAQRRRAGRGALPDERVRSLLETLLVREGRALQESLAHAAGIPAHRFRTTLAMLQRLLNVEGYPVVSFDPDGATVVLDEPLLREQFNLGTGPQ